MVGAEIKRAREAARLSQEELAEKAGIHRTYVSLLERDKKSPTLDVFFRVAAAVGLRASTLIARMEDGVRSVKK